MKPLRRLASLLAALWLCGSGRASAQVNLESDTRERSRAARDSSTATRGAAPPRSGEPRVALLLPACLARTTLGESLRAALALELSSQPLGLLEPERELSAGDVWLEIEDTCGERTDTLILRVSYAGQHYQRALSLTELPSRQQPRAVALAAAELIASALSPADPAEAAFSLEDTEVAPPSTHTAGATASRNAPTTAPPRNERAAEKSARDAASTLSEPSAPSRRFRLSLGAGARGFDGATLFGGTALLELGRFELGPELWVGSKRTALGDVSAALAELRAGYAVQELQPSAALRLAWGPRVGLGWLRLRGSATDPAVEASTRTALYADVALAARVSAVLSSALELALLSEAGLARGLRAQVDGHDAAHYGGAFVGAALQLRLRL